MADKTIDVELRLRQTGDAVKSMKEQVRATEDLKRATYETLSPLEREKTILQEMTRLKQSQAQHYQQNFAQIEAKSRLQQQQMLASHPQMFLQAAAGGGVSGLAGAAQGMLASGGAYGLAAIAAFKVTEEGLRSLGNAANVLGNSTLTANQKVQMLAERIPIIGGLAGALREAVEGLSGMAERLRQMGLTHTISMARIQAQNTGALQKAGLSAEYQGAAAYAGGLANITPQAYTGPLPIGPRDTIEYEHQQRLIELDMSRQRARAEMARQQQMQAQADSDVEAEKRAITLAQGQRARAAQRFQSAPTSAQSHVPGWLKWGAALFNPLAMGSAIYGGHAAETAREKEQRTGAVQAEKEARAQEEGAAARLEAAYQRQHQAALGAGQAESDLRKINIGYLKEELNYINQKLELSKSEAQRFGSMNDLEREQALAIARRYKEQGYENLTPEEKGYLPGHIAAAEAQKAAMRDSRFREYADIYGVDSDIEKLAKEKIKVQAEVNVQVALDEAKLGESIAKALEKTFANMIKAIDARVDRVQRDARTDWRARQTGE